MSTITHTRFSLAQQIDEVRYEIDVRMRVYPPRVTKKLMRQSEAEYHLDRMRAVLATLEHLQAKERT